MAKVHDKFVIELAEVIKGYGNDPDVDDPFHLSEFYRFYELPEIAVSTNNFKAMIPLADVQPVVLCKDCVYWSSKETRYCNMLKGTFQENDYCSYAERRTDE